MIINTLAVIGNLFAAMKDGGSVKEVLDDANNILRRGRNTSLYRKAKESIAFFPVIISSSVSSEPISPLLKALERQFATYIKIAIQQEDIIDLSNSKSKREFLKTLGFNVDNKLLGMLEHVIDNRSMRDAIKKEWKILSETAEKKRKETLSFKPLHEIYDDKKRDSLVSSLSESKRTGGYTKEEIDFIIHQTNDNINVLQSFRSDRDVDRDLNNLYQQFQTQTSNLQSNPTLQSARALERTGERIQNLRAKVDPLYRDDIKRRLKKTDDEEMLSLRQQAADASRETHDRKGVVVNISDSDLKKISELPPTILDVAIYYKSGNTLHETTLTLGIKAVSHILDSEDIISNISKGLKESNSILRFIKWKTGEIKFWKDFLFNIDGIKEDAVQAYKKEDGGLWFRLKYLRHKDALSRVFSRGFTPTAVLVISPSDISEIKKRSGIDLWKKNDVKKLFDTFYIISFLVVDEASRVVHIHNGDDLSFLKVDYNYLAKESSDDSMRTLVGLLTRG